MTSGSSDVGPEPFTAIPRAGLGGVALLGWRTAKPPFPRTQPPAADNNDAGDASPVADQRRSRGRGTVTVAVPARARLNPAALSSILSADPLKLG